MNQSRFIIYTRNLNKPPKLPRAPKPAFRPGRRWYQRLYDFTYWVGLFVLGLIDFVFRFDVYIGIVAVKFVLALARRTVHELNETRRMLVVRVHHLKAREFRFTLVLFLLLAMASWSALKSASLVAYGQQLKEKVLSRASLGGDHLKQAQGALETQNFQKAQNEFLLASASFKNSKGELDQANVVVRKLSDLLPQKRDAESLLAASELISQSGARLLDFQKEVAKLKVSQGGVVAQGQSTASVLDNLYQAISEATDSVARAEKKVNDINVKNIPASYQGEVTLLKDNIKYLSSSLRNLRDVFGLLKSVLTGQKQVLFVFENNNELRATGGFMGTYGAMALKNGEITNLRISSIYELDGQLHEKITPPSPLMNVNDRWFLRDSNWFADFPTSAKKISDFYEKEGGETPDMVVAMTANMVKNLLHVTGPIDMPSYGVTLDEENFIETTQVETSYARDHVTNNPKQLLADFFPILLQKLSDMPPNQTPALIEALNKSFNSKDIAVYSRDAGIEAQLTAYNWAGRVVDSDRDYLNVVTSNLGGTKTDTFMSQVVNLETYIQNNGDIIDTLTVTRANTLPANLEKSDNDSFVRVYVPERSELISSEGFDYKVLDPTVLTGNKRDSVAYDWEKSIVRQSVTGTMIGRESGKTFFGNWVKVKAGETRTVKLTYKLPFKLKSVDRFSLLLQKQMGAEPSHVSYKLNFGNKKVAWKSFSTEELQTDYLTTSLILDKDYFLGAVLTDPNK